jgi:RNA polymerase sigma-70 factor (ECF subfamily)
LSTKPVLYPFSEISKKAKKVRFKTCVIGKPDNHRTAVLMRHDHGMRYKEIAGSLNLTVSAVDSLLVCTRRTLRKILPNLC